MRALAFLVMIAAIPASAQAQEVQEYRVRRGDTCGQIARRVYGHSRRYDVIHQANPELGAMPHHLTPGQTLRLPVIERSTPRKVLDCSRVWPIGPISPCGGS